MVLPLTALISLLPAVLAISQTTPSGNYTPTFITCPAHHEFVRPASKGVSEGEKDWLIARRNSTVPALASYLSRQNITGFDRKGYLKAIECDHSKAPTIALAFSGGGNRAELSDLGLYNALDARVNASVAAGTGGLLQAATYVSGLSGGSVAVSGMAISGFQTVGEMIENNLLNLTYNQDALAVLTGKGELGYPISIADIFGILEAYNFYNVDPSVDPTSWTWSGIQAQDVFKNGSVPMPIIVAAEVIPEPLPGASPSIESTNGTIMVPDSKPGLNLLNTSLTIYEYNPFEFGSWTGRVQAFTDLEYYGTLLKGGTPVNSSLCVQGYDSAIFVTGTCVSALNAWAAEALTNGSFGQFARRSLSKRAYPGQSEWIPYPPNEGELEQVRTAQSLLPEVEPLPLYEQLTGENQTTLIYGRVVNPFYGLDEKSGIYSEAGTQEELLLVDAGESNQENPLFPLIQPARKVDFIIISDNDGSELSSGWMNGTNLGNTAEAAKAAGLPFPKIPSANTMLNLNHTSKPTLYGCNESHVPLVLYAADYPYSTYTNISVLSGTINSTQIAGLTANGLPLLSQDSNRLREGWTECIACASIERSLKRVGMKRPEGCDQCFEKYCWNGQTNETQPSFVEPALVLQPNLTWAEWNATVFY